MLCYIFNSKHIIGILKVKQCSVFNERLIFMAIVGFYEWYEIRILDNTNSVNFGQSDDSNALFTTVTTGNVH